MTDRPAPVFPTPISVGPREWGEEVLLAHAPDKWTLKKITMLAGAEGGLQFHHLKDEGGIMLYGEMEIIYDDGTGFLASRRVFSGDSFHFPPGCVHKARAITACAYYEVSTPHFNDRVHVEKEYGLGEEKGGLPSTRLEDVEVR